MQKNLSVNLNWPVNRAIVQLRKQAKQLRKFIIYVVDNDDRFVGVLSLKDCYLPTQKQSFQPVSSKKPYFS